MNDETLLSSLEELLAKLAIELRYEKGDFVGGLYRYNDSEQMVVNQDLSLTKKINILARELSERVDFENLYMVPALREVIENAGRMGQ
ncbi:hypothetical protein MJD09_08235 [bacterium]|nr:hypothetical protein [bacterium]